MAYYVTVRESSGHRRTTFAAGPFCRHGDAERAVGHVHRLVVAEWTDQAPWLVYGTARVKAGPLPRGRFNGMLGLPREGRIAESPLPDCRWWVPGDVGELDWRTERRGRAGLADRAAPRSAEAGDVKPQCERQVGFRPTLMYNAVSIPRAVICPHDALLGEKFCAAHLDAGNRAIERADARRRDA